MRKRPTQSWQEIAKQFYDAFKKCNWSFGRAQDTTIHDFLDVADLDYRDKLEIQERGKKRRRRT